MGAPTQIDEKYAPVVAAALLNTAYGGGLTHTWKITVLANEYQIIEDYREFLRNEETDND